ncbi:MAG TPA: allantoinase AllB [Candidatus Saccharimonadales bacterium]|jgi:allantoinase|nr:allantoinase AllB [Candidatus Saccharimonadales bacterium]
MTELVVRGGTVVTPENAFLADVAIDEGRITDVAPGLPGGAREIDARGLTILPGIIDIHVHFNEPGRTEWEGAASGSRALAAGGGALFFDMPLNSSPCTVGPAEFDLKRAALERSSIADFALWGGIVPGNRAALAPLGARGVIGFKAFMADSGLPEFPCSDDQTLHDAMHESARLGLPVAVHAESEDLIQASTARLLAAGQTGIRDFLESRPVRAEVEAIRRAGLLAAETGARLHIVHVSSGSGVAEALEARKLGADISIETCPHYLFFTDEDMERIGAPAKCAPPLRDRHERQALWAALLRGEIDVVASDHSPAPPEMKHDANFFRVWGGIAGVESTLAVLLTQGHRDHGLALTRIAALLAAWPAQRFGLANKGRIAVGNDADLALVDLAAVYTLEAGQLFQRHRLSPYIGREFRGVVRATLRRGETIFADGKITAQGAGKMIVRKQSAVST